METQNDYDFLEEEKPKKSFSSRPVVRPINDPEVQEIPVYQPPSDPQPHKNVANWLFPDAEKHKIPRLPEPMEATEMNEAHVRHLNNDPPAAIITTKCDENGGCEYKDDCPILTALDDYIYHALCDGVIIGTEVRFCKSYRAKHYWSQFPNRN